MKRSAFLKKLGFGLASAVVAPSIFMSKDNTKFIDSEAIKAPQPNSVNNSPAYSRNWPTYENGVPVYKDGLWSITVDNTSSANFNIAGKEELNKISQKIPIHYEHI
jgi:hypothetical protein